MSSNLCGLLENSPVVAKVLLLDVPDGECVAIGPRVHDAPIGRLDGEGVLVPGHLQRSQVNSSQCNPNWVQQQQQHRLAINKELRERKKECDEPQLLPESGPNKNAALNYKLESKSN